MLYEKIEYQLANDLKHKIYAQQGKPRMRNIRMLGVFGDFLFSFFPSGLLKKN